MQKRSAEEVGQWLRGYQESGLPRQEYCRQLGIPVTTFDYYRQRKGRKAAADKRAAVKLVKVEVKAPVEGMQSVFAVVLRNGRRIESAGNWTDAELARLIRIVEAA